MLKERYLRIYDLHSWTGIALGLFVFMVSFTGCLALFDYEIKTWEDLAKRLEIVAEPAAINAELTQWIGATAGEDKITFLGVYYPDHYTPFYRALMQTRNGDGETEQHDIRWNSATGEALPARGGGLSEWLLDFHRDLMWPAELGGRRIGRTLVGIGGVILMLSILTGILTHTKIIREFFTLRYDRTIRLKWQDTHKVLGLWMMPFYIMISFTGAFLGIIAILSPIIAMLAFKGDTDALISAVVGGPPEASGEYARMLSADDIARMYHPVSGHAPARFIVENWGDKAAEIKLLYTATSELANYDQIVIDGVSGEVLREEPISSLNAANRVTNAVTPLHYGTFGGIWLKVLYFLMGLSLCIITATGLMMWIERRLHGKAGSMSHVYYQRLGRLVAGFTAGLPLASISIFYLDKMYTGAEVQRIFWTGSTYFIVWFVAIGWAWFQQNTYLIVKRLLYLAALGMMGIPVVNAIYTKQVFWSVLGSGASWAWVDLSFIITGALTLSVSIALPSERREQSSKVRQQSTPAADLDLPEKSVF